MEGEEPTQATQNVLDPRRVGKQNSGFSDEDISDIVCVLYPHSDTARQEVLRLAHEDSPHIIGRDEADGVEPDYELEDHASRFEHGSGIRGEHAIILRLSSQVKSPEAGFAFGRNRARCDVVFVNDPVRRISNIHFRIYVNEYGNVMIEDQSTNGTWVDRTLLTANPRNGGPPTRRWVLSSGNRVSIYLHDRINDLTFRVRIPRRDDEYDRAYITKVQEYFARHGLQGHDETVGPGPDGFVRLFGHTDRTPATKVESGSLDAQMQSPAKRREAQNLVRREWTGSGKYNRIGTIGKGAFAVVYKVTSKYDGRPYAAKELEKRRFIKNGVLDQKVENEMKIMQRVHHPNIVRYIENFDWDDCLLIIIMEYVPFGDLGKRISDEGPLQEDMAQVMSKQLLSAMEYLHDNNITHRDVKPDNILINSLDPLEVKLTDFGLSKMVDTEQTFLRTFCGTLLYCAPEVYTEYTEYDDNGIRNRGKKVRRIPGQRYNHAVDIWSLGGVIFYALTSSPPYPVKSGISHSELLHKIMTTRLNISPLQRRNVSEQGIDFLSRMLHRRPENRATIAELSSHLWLGGPGSTIKASQSYDEITDEEDFAVEPSQHGPDEFEADRVSDSMGEESDKENNTTYGGNPQGPRLFGEVGASALGSSGVIPEDFLNLPVSNTSMGETEIMDSYEEDAYDSDYSSTPRHGNRRGQRQSTVSIAQNQSADQLHSLVEDVASQSLGGDESVRREPVDPLVDTTRSIDFNASKRKPPTHDTSEEFDDDSPPEKPIIKRLKSEGNIEGISDDMLQEFKLLACMPQIRRLGSGRQVDRPVSKITFWEQDRRTWHLQYPEMTQLQYDAFSEAARSRGEDFAPGKSPLWGLAMKYFSPTLTPEDQIERTLATPPVGLKRDDRKVSSDPADFPPTAAPVDTDSLPDTLPPETQIVVPVQLDTMPNRAVGMVESHHSSCIQGISFPITDSLICFGRGPENTEIFEPRTEPRVPKYAFKVMLWKEGYDPAKDPAKVSLPWLRDSLEDGDQYSFWISTKATLGIRINGLILPSSDSKNPSGPSQYWTRLYDGDALLVWGGGSSDQRNQTKLIFRCFWGGSSTPRGEGTRQLEMALPEMAQRLDSACQRTEKRIRETREKQRKVSEAKGEHQEREAMVERERERSRAFEMRRKEAIEFLQARQAQQSSRKQSPASGPPTAYGSRLHVTQASRMSPENELGYSVR